MPDQKLSIVGLGPEDEGRVRDLVSRMAPQKLPQNGIAFLDGKSYNKLRSQIENGTLDGQRIGQTSGDNGDERFGGSFTQSRTNIGDALTVKPIGRIYVLASAVKNQSKLAELLAHELGHANAPDDSEGGADKMKALFLQRAQQAAKIDAGVQAQPVTTQPAPGILSGSLKDVQPPAAPQGGVLGGISNQGQTK